MSKNVLKSSAVSSLAMLQEIFPKRIRITAQEVAALLGYTYGSLRTLKSRGKLPIKSCISNGNMQFDIRDIAIHLDATRAKTTANVGRPCKIETVEAKRRGITVSELRAQSSLVLEVNHV